MPSAARPVPVVLVHGTWGNQNSWDVLAPKLKATGHCVFALNFGRDTSSMYGAQPGVYGTGDIRASARELAGFLDRVREATGAGQVDIVAHSQGGLVARQYMRFDGGADPTAPERNTVRRLITVGATNHGTTLSNLGYLLPTGSAAGPGEVAVARVLGPAAAQQVVGSEFLRALNAGGDTEPGVHYTVIASRVDEITTPPETTFLRAGPGSAVDNVWVQNVCAGDTFGHAKLPTSPTVIHIVQRALDPAHTASRCPS
ncbi:esterase/lipase family protein [Nocardia mexicana]|uniref:esterase/lipase family protein n=1 Tax=Nocardia mexicana TaxID=279262 RepID=UPI001FE352FB|nr:alpha/beta fold hydrolase [Nocardia mexicana]